MKGYYLFVTDCDEKNYCLVHSSLRNIDNLTSNFNDEKPLIEFLKQFFDSIANIKIVGIKLLHYKDESSNPENIGCIYSDKNFILDDNNLLDEINKFLTNYSNVYNMRIDEISNPYLLSNIRNLKSLGHTTIPNYNRNVKLYVNKLKNNYIDRRILAYFIANNSQRFVDKFSKPVDGKKDMKAIEESLKAIMLDQKQIDSQQNKFNTHKTYFHYRLPDMDDDDYEDNKNSKHI